MCHAMLHQCVAVLRNLSQWRESMRSENQKLFSLAAIVVAAVLFGMVLAGGLDLTPGADAKGTPPISRTGSCRRWFPSLRPTR